MAEEAVAVSRIAALERRAKPVRRATRAVRTKGTAGGLRQVVFSSIQTDSGKYFLELSRGPAVD